MSGRTMSRWVPGGLRNGDEGHKSDSSYNIAYQLQGMRLDAERSEFHPLEARPLKPNICVTKEELQEPGTISLSIAQVEHQVVILTEFYKMPTEHIIIPRSSFLLPDACIPSAQSRPKDFWERQDNPETKRPKVAGLEMYLNPRLIGFKRS
ncbi:hypothetical protein B0H19DRAFT_1079024 [Mycena capillaripes]|nr:hypothetical protein B0H19DRAFT_1079024 [Mycena capillaripes]